MEEIDQEETIKDIIMVATEQSCTDGTDHPYRAAVFDPYITPDSTPPPPGALLCGTICQLNAALVINEGSSTAAEGLRVVDEVIPLVDQQAPGAPNRGLNREAYRVWEAAFNSGRSFNIVGLINNKPVSHGKPRKAQLQSTRHPDRKG